MRINIFPPTSHRVFLRTDPMVNNEIRKQTLKNIELLKKCNEEEITDRIRKLNQEWDTERFLEVNAASLMILSSFLGIRHSRLWFLVTGVIGMFMLQHALQGWCPPVPIIRKWGVRTADEIHGEKTALKIIRGDFAQLDANTSSVKLLDAAHKQ